MRMIDPLIKRIIQIKTDFFEGTFKDKHSCITGISKYFF